MLNYIKYTQDPYKRDHSYLLDSTSKINDSNILGSDYSNKTSSEICFGKKALTISKFENNSIYNSNQNNNDKHHSSLEQNPRNNFNFRQQYNFDRVGLSNKKPHIISNHRNCSINLEKIINPRPKNSFKNNPKLAKIKLRTSVSGVWSRHLQPPKLPRNHSLMKKSMDQLSSPKNILQTSYEFQNKKEDSTNNSIPQISIENNMVSPKLHPNTNDEYSLSIHTKKKLVSPCKSRSKLRIFKRSVSVEKNDIPPLRRPFTMIFNPRENETCLPAKDVQILKSPNDLQQKSDSPLQNDIAQRFVSSNKKKIINTLSSNRPYHLNSTNQIFFPRIGKLQSEFQDNDKYIRFKNTKRNKVNGYQLSKNDLRHSEYFNRPQMNTKLHNNNNNFVQNTVKHKNEIYSNTVRRITEYGVRDKKYYTSLEKRMNSSHKKF